MNETTDELKQITENSLITYSKYRAISHNSLTLMDMMDESLKSLITRVIKNIDFELCKQFNYIHPSIYIYEEIYKNKWDHVFFRSFGYFDHETEIPVSKILIEKIEIKDGKLIERMI